MPRESAPDEELTRELRASLGKLEVALGAIPEALAWVGPSGNIQWCNGTLCELVGKPRLAVLGRPFAEVVTLESGDGSALNAADQPLARAEASPGREHRQCYRDRQGRILEVSARLVDLTASEQGFVLVCRDVTERKRQEAASLRLAAVAESTDDAIWAARFDGRITDWNRAAERLYGYSAEEAVGRDISLVLPEGRKDEFKPLFERLFRGERVPSHESLRRKRDGVLVPVWITLSPVREPGGRPIGVSGIIRDLTPRKEAEQALRNANGQLAEAYRDLESFNYSVAHDLKSPLRAMVSFVELFLRKARLNPQDAQPLRQALAAGTRMRELIEDLGKLSLATFGEMRREPVDLSALAAEVVAGLQQAQPRPEVQVIINKSLHAAGDPGLLRVVLENLFANAWKFTAARPDARIELGVEDEADGRAFFVRDNGIGFEPSQAQELFVPFKRLHGSQYPGSGIGLSIVRRVILRHGGRVWAESEHGATIYFTLTPSDAPEKRDDGAPRSEHPAACERLVLIVDDNPGDVELAEFALSEAAPDCRVEHVFSGEDALNLLRSKQRLPAVILLDIQMPGLSGFDVLQRIRADADLSASFVALFSSSKEPRDIERGRALKADLHMQKPADLGGYLTIARQVVQIVERRVAGSRSDGDV